MSKKLTLWISGKKDALPGDWVWITIGQIASALGFLTGMRILTQYVSPGIMGTVSLLTGVAALVTTTFFTPFLEAALRFYPDASRAGQVRLLRETINAFLLKTAKLLFPALAVTVLFLFLAYRKKITFLVALASLCGLLTVDLVKTKERNFLNASRRQKTLAAWLAMDAWARFLAATATVLVFGSSAGTVLSGYFAGSLMVLICFYKKAGHPHASDRGAGDEALYAGIRRYALPIIPMAMVGWITSLSDRYVIGALTGLEQVGIYWAAYGLASRPFLMAGGIIEQTLRPVYFNAVSSSDKVEEKKAFLAMLSITVFACFCLVAIITMMRVEIAGLLLDKKYRSGVELMPWIALGYAFLVISYVFEKICYAYKKTKAVSLVQTAGAVASLCIGIPLIYYYGVRGASIAVPIYFGFQLAVSAVAAKQVLKNVGRVGASSLPVLGDLP